MSESAVTGMGATTSVDHVASAAHVPALDGIRAVAVLFVLAYHGGATWLGGGFLGVSVFFTLSGFLITSLLINESSSSGRIDLGRFWARRFRRLLPASWLTIASVVTLGVFGLWGTEQLRSLRTDVPWSLAELVNWHFIATGTTYGQEFAAPSPLQHYWSLAVEQQFYVMLPLIVVGVLAAARRRGTSPLRWLGGAFVTLMAGSLLANGMLGVRSVDRAYFGTDTRAAELLVGALLAVAVASRGALMPGPSRRLVGPLGLAGLATITAMSVVASVDDRWLYPWGLFGCAISTTTVIVAGRQRTTLARVLSWRVVTWIGRISYGVYLFHWPIYLVLTPTRLGFDGPALHGLRIALTLAVAALSHRFLEHPVRTGAMLSTAAIRGVVPVAAGAVLLAGLVTTSGLPPVADFLQPRATGDVRVIEPLPSASNETTTTVSVAPPSGPASSDPPPASAAPPGATAPAATAPVRPATTPPATTPPATTPPRRATRVLLVGDSIAASLETELGRALGAQGVTFATAASPGCGVVTGFPTDEEGRIADMTRACDAGVPDRQRSAVSSFRPDLVVALSSWEITNRQVDGRWYQQGTSEMDQALRVLYAQAIDRLSRRGAVVSLTRLPDMVDGQSKTLNPEENTRSRRLNEVISSIAAERRGVVDLALDTIVCPTTPCPTEVDGMALRAADGRHFAEPAAARWVAERWAQQILAIDLNAT